MADGEDYDFIPVVVVQDDIGSLAEFDDPLAELGRHFFHRAANLGMTAEDFDALPDGGNARLSHASKARHGNSGKDSTGDGCSVHIALFSRRGGI